MKPKRKFVEIEYWCCGNENHRHKTKEVATRCIEKYANKKSKQSAEVNYARYIHASRLIVEGSTLKDAGESIGVSSGRARQVFMKVIRMSMHPKRSIGAPPCGYSNMKEIRLHKEHFLKRIQSVADSWGV